jgi:hypothetical protein
MFDACIDVIVDASQEETQDQDVFLKTNQCYCTLFAALGYSAEEAPVADLLKRYDGLSGDWLIASPIFWEATHNNAMIRHAESQLILSEDDSRYLFSAFSEFVAEQGMHMYYHDAKTWLIQAEHLPIPQTMPVHLLINQSMLPALQSLQATPDWMRFFTESQMFFSALKKPVNGVWVWGGAKPTRPSSQRSLIFCGDQHWLTVAKHLSTDVRCYDADQTIQRRGIYFVPNAHWLQVSGLNNNLTHFRTRWHWNNLTYTTHPKYWFSWLLR